LIDASWIEAPGGAGGGCICASTRSRRAWCRQRSRPSGTASGSTGWRFRAGENRIGDRGYPQPDGLRNTREAGVDVLVRLTWNSLRRCPGTAVALVPAVRDSASAGARWIDRYR
jgi:hypothetical protein